MSSLFERKLDGSEGPTQRTRLAGYTLNGEYRALPQHLPYLEQVKLVGAGFFEAAMLSEKVSLSTYEQPIPGLTAAQADRLLEALMLAEEADGDDMLIRSLRRLTQQ